MLILGRDIWTRLDTVLRSAYDIRYLIRWIKHRRDSRNSRDCSRQMESDQVDAATVRFQRSLPYSLCGISSDLTAAHIRRLRLEGHSDPNFCTKCGHSATWTSSTRLVRRKNERTIETSCNICGLVRRKLVHPKKTATPNPNLRPTGATAPANTDSTPKPTKKTKKNSVLQNMLSASRDRAQQHQTTEGSLAAFLLQV